MHDIEPYYNWRDYYISEEDERSPFFKREYSEFDYENTIYNFYIHPQWDDFGSNTLYTKVLFADYIKGFVIMEFIGEWNDIITNDIMLLKRDVIDVMIANGITKFILIGENILNFHCGYDDYYQEWFEDIEDGWFAAINFQPHVIDEVIKYNIDQYMAIGGELNQMDWRTYKPQLFFKVVENLIRRRLILPGQTL